MNSQHKRVLVAAAALALVTLGLWMGGASPLGGIVTASVPHTSTGTGIDARLVAVSDADWSSRHGADPPNDKQGRRSLRITGRVTSDDPTLDFTKVKVAATPAGVYASRHFAGADHVARPGDYGWVIANCDADGAFVLEDGVDPYTTYRLTAAGDGSVSATDGKKSFSPGDDVTLQLTPLYGLEVLFVDELQRTWEWPDFRDPPCSIVPSDRTAKLVHPSHIALALHGLPGWMENTSSGLRRTYAVGRPDLQMTIYAFPRGHTDRLTFPTQLYPVRDGLRRIKKVIPGAVVSYPPVTVVIPEALLELMLGDEDTLSFQCMLEFRSTGKLGHYVLKPRFERGKNTWTTTALPPGRYTNKFDMAFAAQFGLSMDPEEPGAHRGKEIELTQGGTTLYMPNLSYTTFELRGFRERLGKHTSVVSSKFGGPTSGYARFDRPPYRIPVIWDANVRGKRGYIVAVTTSNGDIDFVGPSGEERVQPRHGENVKVFLPPTELSPGPGAVAR